MSFARRRSNPDRIRSFASRAIRASRAPLALAVAAATLLAGRADAAIVELVTYLKTTNEVVVPQPIPANAEGIAYFRLDTDTNRLEYYIEAGALSGPEAVTHIHGPSTPDTLGDILYTLPLGNPKIASLTYEEEHEQFFLDGAMYLNLHTETNVLGELRGQMASFVAIMEGDQETNATGSGEVGMGVFMIDTAANTLDYYIRDSVPDMVETAAHIHGFAPHGADGPVLHTLPAMSPKIGTWNYEESQEASILAGLTYVNIHTPTNPGGEIRGQIVNRLSFLSPTRENPTPTGADGAFGIGMFSHDAGGSRLGYRVVYQSLSSSETAAHIHGFAPAGFNAIARESLPLGPLKIGFWDFSEFGEVPLSSLYVNVHTENNASGEIRAWVEERPGVATPVNLSTRGFVGPVESGEAMIGGFIVGGTAGRRVLVTGIGPDLANFGVTGVLANPTLLLFQGQTMLDSNDDWMDSADRDLIAETGRAPNSPLESAVILDLGPGEYTAILSGVGEGDARTGVGLVQAFDVGPAGGSTGASGGALSNLSTRIAVGTGDRVMIGGFTVSGTLASAQVLVRGLGPTLGAPPFNVPGALADPELLLFGPGEDGPVQIASNTNWIDSADQAAIADSGYAPSDDLEPAILATLPPGEYTAIVSGAGGTQGVALVEVYQLASTPAGTGGGDAIVASSAGRGRASCMKPAGETAAQGPDECIYALMAEAASEDAGGL